MVGSTERSVGRRPTPRDRPPTPYTAESLLAVAVAAFIERGYDGTSMEHLSQALGIGKSSIYHHVSGKEELLRRAVERAIEALFGVLDEPGAGAGSAEQRLRYVIGRTTEVLLAEQPYVTLLLRVRGNTDTEQWAMERRREFDRRVTALLRQAAADGDVRSDIDPRLTTRLLFGMINSIVEWHARRAGGRDREIVDAVVGLAFRGLSAEPPASLLDRPAVDEAGWSAPGASPTAVR
jgi:AcrR family transcriptional regulator